VQNESPFNSIPPVVIVLAGAVFVVEAVLSLAGAGMLGGREGIGWRVAAFEDYGYSPAVWELVVERGYWVMDYLRRFVTYAFVHPTFTSALFGGAMLLALGKFVGDIFHWAAVLAVALVSCIIGAAVFGAFAPGNPPLLGVYPMVYGMIGAFTYLMWLRLGQMGQNQLAAFRLIGFLLGIQLAFGLLFGGGWTWIADLSGFVAGLFVAPFVAPGGWAAFVRRMRQR
jgi:membrane associated rhomboid family serine protease